MAALEPSLQRGQDILVSPCPHQIDKAFVIGPEGSRLELRVASASLMFPFSTKAKTSDLLATSTKYSADAITNGLRGTG